VPCGTLIFARSSCRSKSSRGTETSSLSAISSLRRRERAVWAMRADKSKPRSGDKNSVKVRVRFMPVRLRLLAQHASWGAP
jgi:hypothetical protein